ncbi:helix-turn-helix transcriptional regulator [Serratia fonticola]|uniref:helix-turn-helix transcriptional regulator n=1 Tax=Serratia fonticola TaxID=47917 RepID=UPI003BB6B749
MENIVLLCECSFTRIALEMLLQQPQAQVFGVADVEQCRLHMSRSLDGEVDLVILSVSNYRIDALLRLATLIRCCHPSCQVLIDPGSASIPLLRFYLNCLNTHVGLIDLTQTLLALQGFIGQVMRGEKVLSTRDIICGERLNWRERNVLQGLMEELSAQDIAKTLVLNVKTISHYKRSGLSKLGARNIQELLIPAVGSYPDVSATIQLQNIADVMPYQKTTTGYQGNSINEWAYQDLV